MAESYMEIAISLQAADSVIATEFQDEKSE